MNPQQSIWNSSGLWYEYGIYSGSERSTFTQIWGHSMDISKHTMIGEILIARGRITRSQLNMAKRLQETARRSGETLVADGIISSKEFDIALGWQLAEAIVGLGYAGEREVFGSLRIGVAKGCIRTGVDLQFHNAELDDCSDF